MTVTEVAAQGTTESRKERKWDKRTFERYEGWKRLKPTIFVSQYAGGMGLHSNGVGWSYGKRRQGETNIMLGYLPKRHAGRYRLTFTLKQNYIPWSMSIDEHWNVEPFYCGLYFTTIAGSEFWKEEPGKYPNHYYNICTKIRPYIFVGQRVGFAPGHRFIRNIQMFYEISSCDLYIVSKVGNKTLKPRDFLRLSFGVKMDLFPKNLKK